MAASSSFGLVQPMKNYYEYILSLRDPRTVGWPLVVDPKFMLPLLAGYLYVVKIGGPRWMKDRKPFQVKPAIMAYNLFMVVASSYFFWQFLKHSFIYGGYSLLCQGVSYATDEHTMAILNLMWWYIFVRIADFLDTFFFLARKKFSHITALHVTHHFLVVFSAWLWITFGSDGQVLLGICVNSFIHIIMYSYYFLAALGPSVRKYLWWKKYLTRIQIVQFACLTLHMTVPLFYDCGYPMVLNVLAVAQGLLGLGLFINFYVHTYALNANADMCTLQGNIKSQ